MQTKKMPDPQASHKQIPRGDANTTFDDPRTFGAPLFELQRSARERIRISVDRFKGRDYIVARIWFVGASGEFKPSRQAITLKPSLVPQLIQGLELAARAADPQGAR